MAAVTSYENENKAKMYIYVAFLLGVFILIYRARGEVY